MPTDKFIRDFRLEVLIENSLAIITPPMKISFEIYKSIFGGLNKANIKLYNISPSTRLRMVKDAEDFEVDLPITLYIGYKNRIELGFKGSILRCNNKREGADITTNIEAYDGGYGVMFNYISSATIDIDDPIDDILGYAPSISRGKISEREELTRPKIIVGSVAKALDAVLQDGETWYIDDEKLYIIKVDEVTSNFVPVVSAETGLISTPERENKIVTFTQLIDPTVKIGHQAALRSTTSPHLNGVYKIQDIEYIGDNYGDQWFQVCRGILLPEVVVL